MAWFRRHSEQDAIEASLLQSFYSAALASAESYDVAKERVDEKSLLSLFDRLRSGHFNFANSFKKRIKQLGADPEQRAGLGEAAGRIATQVNMAGSVRDLLVALRSGEENGVAMCREALENVDLRGKTQSLLASAKQFHIDNIRDLSEEIAIRGGVVETGASLLSPQWLRYPKPGFWLLAAGLIGLGYVFGRSKQNGQPQRRESPRAALEEREAQTHEVGV